MNRWCITEKSILANRENRVEAVQYVREIASEVKFDGNNITLVHEML